MEDLEFEQLLIEKRHKEIKKSLDTIAIAIDQWNDNGITEAFEEYATTIRNVIKNLGTQLQSETTVDIHQTEVVEALKKMEQSLLIDQKNLLLLIRQLLVMMQEKKTWQFKLNRSANGSIDNVIVKQI